MIWKVWSLSSLTACAPMKPTWLLEILIALDCSHFFSQKSLVSIPKVSGVDVRFPTPHKALLVCSKILKYLQFVQASMLCSAPWLMAWMLSKRLRALGLEAGRPLSQLSFRIAASSLRSQYPDQKIIRTKHLFCSVVAKSSYLEWGSAYCCHALCCLRDKASGKFSRPS